MDRCYIINRHPEQQVLGSLYMSELRMQSSNNNNKNNGDNGDNDDENNHVTADGRAELLDMFDVNLPDDCQQVALFDHYHIVRTVNDRLLLCSSGSIRPPRQLNDSCVHLLQVRNRVIVVVKTLDGYQLKNFNFTAVDRHFNGLEFLGVTLSRFFSLSGRIVLVERDGVRQELLRLTVAAKDGEVLGIASHRGSGILLLEIDHSNVVLRASFRRSFVCHQTRLCVREKHLLVWPEGDLNNVTLFEISRFDCRGDTCDKGSSKGDGHDRSTGEVHTSYTNSDDDEDDDMEDDRGENLVHRNQKLRLDSGPLGDRSSNFIAEVNGEVVAVFGRLTKGPTAISRPGLVCYRLKEYNQWTEICSRRDAVVHSICVTHA